MEAEAAIRPAASRDTQGQNVLFAAFSLPSDQSFMGMDPVGGGGTDSVIIKFAKDPAPMIEALIAKVEAMNLHQGTENSFDAKLNNALIPAQG